MNTLLYIDPASTALIWQILAGIFISLGVVLGVFWRKITTFFKSVWVKVFHKNKKKNKPEQLADESMLELEEDEITENNNANVAENENASNEGTKN